MLTIFVGQPPIVTSYLFIYLYFEFIIFLYNILLCTNILNI